MRSRSHRRNACVHGNVCRVCDVWQRHCSKNKSWMKGPWTIRERGEREWDGGWKTRQWQAEQRRKRRKRWRMWRMTDGELGRGMDKKKTIYCAGLQPLQPLINTHTLLRITTNPKQWLAQAGWCCCRSNKGAVWEGGDSRQGGCEGIGWEETLCWCHPSLPLVSPVHPFIPSHPSPTCRHPSIQWLSKREREGFFTCRWW